MSIRTPLRRFTLAILAALLISPLAQAQSFSGNWNTVISPAAGGTKTAISISNSGNVATGYTWTNPLPLAGLNIGFTGLFGAASGGWSLNSTNNVSAFGYITNITTGSNMPYVTFRTLSFAPGQGALNITYAINDTFLANDGDTLASIMSPSPAQFEIDVAFSNFTPGTYTGEVSAYPGFITTVEIVPEPSTYALLALSAAGLGGYVLRRRRK